MKLVMPGLEPGIHVFGATERKTWMAGTSPAMTKNQSAASHASHATFRLSKPRNAQPPILG
jgi:hypothetical protein